MAHVHRRITCARRNRSVPFQTLQISVSPSQPHLKMAKTLLLHLHGTALAVSGRQMPRLPPIFEDTCVVLKNQRLGKFASEGSVPPPLSRGAVAMGQKSAATRAVTTGL